MDLIITSRSKIWDIEDKGKYAEASLSEGRKVDDSAYDKIQIDNGIARNGYINTTRKYVRFVGEAYTKIKQINNGDTIVNLKSSFTREPHWDSATNTKVFPIAEKMTVFDFEIYDGSSQTNTNKNFDRAPQVEKEVTVTTTTETSSMTTENTVNNATAADACPF